MQTIGCPTCGDPLAEGLRYCARCGSAVPVSELGTVTPVQGTPPAISTGEQLSRPPAFEVETGASVALSQDTPESLNAVREPVDTEATIPLPGRLARRTSSTSGPGEDETTIQFPKRQFKGPRTSNAGQAEVEVTLHLPPEASVRAHRQEHSRGVSRFQFTNPGSGSDLEWEIQEPLDETEQDDRDDEIVQHHGTWQKIVEHRNSAFVPAIPRAGTLRQVYQPLRLITRVKARAPRAVFWLGTLLLVALLLSGAFGLAVSFGRNARKAVPNPSPILQASPDTIALGGIITLRGSHFTPAGEIALSRDQQIALLDTSGSGTIQADAQGFFSDTFVADPSWLAGRHLLYASDLRMHHQALVPVLVTGTNALQGPPHLVLSSSTLDLGSGDRVTNASKLLALSNAGGGQATWRANVNQTWLSITPQSGSIASGKHLAALVTAARARLAPGSYQGSIVFTSNTGQVTLIVTLTVTPLRPSHEAIMQATPASLAFDGAVRGDEPLPRIVTLSNPGILPLTWGVNTNGAGWLWAAPSSGTIPAGGQQQITVGVTTDGLSSGVYRGSVSFLNQGAQPVQGAPQSIYVSLTVTPACTLTLSTSSLSFSGQHAGANPASQALGIGVAGGCNTDQHWTASSSDAWLKVASAAGTTPSTVRVSVNTGGLAPGTYDGTLTFTDNLGSKMLDVTLVVTPIPCQVAGPSALSLQGTAGQAGLVGQSMTVSASGDCTHSLSWTASSSGGSWLSATISGSSATAAALSIQANLSGLNAGTYSGTVTITAVDSVTNQTIGTLGVAVTLTAQSPPPPCTLQSPTPGALSFAASNGASPATPTESFTIGITGACSGNVTITPTVDAASAGWLAVSSPVSLASGSQATFTVSVTSSSLASGNYTGTITLDAGIAGSYTVTVTLAIQ